MAVKVLPGGSVAGLQLHVQQADKLVLDAQEVFGLTPKAVTRAQVRAVNKTVRWLKAQAARAVAGGLGVAVKHIKRRVFMSLAKGSVTTARFWLGVGGINPMSLGLTGRKTSKGYRVGKFFFGGGFRGYYKGRWEGEPGGIYERKGASRLPIQSIDIEVAGVADQVIKRLFDRAEVELAKKLKQELNYEMHKAAGTA